MQLDMYAEALFQQLKGAKALVLVDETKAVGVFYNPAVDLSPQEEEVIGQETENHLRFIERHELLEPNCLCGLVFMSEIALTLDAEIYANGLVCNWLSHPKYEYEAILSSCCLMTCEKTGLEHRHDIPSSCHAAQRKPCCFVLPYIWIVFAAKRRGIHLWGGIF